VVCLDNLYTGSIKNIKKFSDNKSFKFIEHDVATPYFIEVDGIFNFACPASPIHYQKYPVETLKTNVLGTINALDLAKKLNIPILQASTSEVYGDPKISPQPESYWGNVNPFGFRSCYDEGKRAAETLFFDYHSQFNVDIKIARIFNTYGPFMAKLDGRVISNFIIQALENKDLTVFGDGSQRRSFCYVDDLINGVIKLFFKVNVNFPVNIGNPRSVSMIELAQEIISIIGSKSEIKFLSLPADDPKDRQPDISLARSLIKWEPKIERTVGLAKTVEYFRSII
jgi:UDP-glucuronate decarboxylase